eukprot:TRINITY_DN45_c0_g2_i1.p1 TRINITY_DN45_c0_g2~~TRINITY_DN45_c0_g2_i1.p1  ORF type:complete len:291 (+),score=27.08 TRINITY_DN45_c0_g2_i1:135-1007(+)
MASDRLLILSILCLTLFLCPYASALDSMSVMHASWRCNLAGKQAQYPFVNWGAADVQAGITSLYNQFKGLSNSNDYVYCSLLGYLVLMIKTSFEKRQCGNGDSFCYYPNPRPPAGNYPDCSAYYCGKQKTAYCNGVWGTGQCRVINNKCFINCMKFKINWSTSGWSMFSNTFSDKFWKVNGNLYWGKKSALPGNDTVDYSPDESPRQSPEQEQSLRKDDKRESQPMKVLKSILGKLSKRRLSRRQAILSGCGECGCSWNTPPCYYCDNQWIPMGATCMEGSLCCQCWMIS